MVILLDENLPHQLRLLLGAHDVRTVAYQGWAGLTNGVLLKAAEDAGLDVFVTGDQGIRHQQNLRHLKMSLVVHSENDGALVISNAERIAKAVEVAKPGEIHWVLLDPRTT